MYKRQEAKTASGFAYAKSDITDANFKQVVGQGIVGAEAVLVNFGEFVESPDAVSRLKKMGLRAGVPKELADLSKAHPDSRELATCLPIVALGDSWEDPDGFRLVVCLYGVALSRELQLYLWGYGWYDFWWFLAFRK